MWHDLLCQQFQVLHVVKHRVQQQMPGASTHDRGELLGAFRGTAPDPALGAHVGAAVADAEPLTQAPFGAVAIVIHGEIDALDPLALPLSSELQWQT